MQLIIARTITLLFPRLHSLCTWLRSAAVYLFSGTKQIIIGHLTHNNRFATGHTIPIPCRLQIESSTMIIKSCRCVASTDWASRHWGEVTIRIMDYCCCCCFGLLRWCIRVVVAMVIVAGGGVETHVKPTIQLKLVSCSEIAGVKRHALLPLWSVSFWFGPG